MEKVFRYSSEKRALANNQKHNFALKNTFSIYQSESAYSFIPKNACSTLRYSIAIANGCISSSKEIDWIHSNNQTFTMSTESAYRAKYKFAILRCPFTRMFSCYMDKAVNMDIQIWQYRNARNRSFHPHDLTFEYFIKDIGCAPLPALDIHWRPQVDFLVFESYDDLFCLEQFQNAQKTLKEKINFDVFDTRPFLNHHLSDLIPDNTIRLPYRKTAIDLLILKRNGKIPDTIAMYNDELVNIVKEKYKNDIDIYIKNFGPSKLMEVFL